MRAKRDEQVETLERAGGNTVVNCHDSGITLERQEVKGMSVRIDNANEIAPGDARLRFIPSQASSRTWWIVCDERLKRGLAVRSATAREVGWERI